MGRQQAGSGYGAGQQKKPGIMEDDDEFGAGKAGQTGGQNRGGQNP